MQNPFEAPTRHDAPVNGAGVPGTGRLYTLAWIDLGWSVLAFGLYSIFPSWDLRDAALDLFFLTTTMVWGVLAAAWAWLLYGYAQGRRGTSAEASAHRAFLAAAAGVVLLVLQEGLTRLGADFVPGRVINTAAVLVGFGGDLLLFSSLTRSLTPLPGWMTPTYVGLRGVALFFALPHLILGHETYEALFRSTGLHEPLRFIRMPLNVAHQGVMIFVLGVARRFLGPAQGASPAPAQAPSGEGPGPDRQRDLLIGAAWLVGGLFVTLLSYQAASGGGRYLVTTGAIVYGAVRIGRGLLRGGGGGR